MGASKYFSLERLISIYAQVAGIITHRPAAGYGDTALYATVSDGESVFTFVFLLLCFWCDCLLVVMSYYNELGCIELVVLAWALDNTATLFICGAYIFCLNLKVFFTKFVMLHILHQLTTLVEKGLLQQYATGGGSGSGSGSGSTSSASEQRQLYMSCIAQDTAERLSREEKFPLHDFMYNNQLQNTI